MQKEIEKIVKNFFSFFRVKEIYVKFPKEEVVEIEIRDEGPEVLIGERGANLIDFQKILGIILQKNFGRTFKIEIDVNNYRKQKEAYLRQLARETADEVLILKTEKKLPPMPPHERKVIHEEISKIEGVYSQSEGEGYQKQIVIKPF